MRRDGAARDAPVLARMTRDGVSAAAVMTATTEKGAACNERERENASRVSGSVGRVTERRRVPLAPALTRLPDTVTSPLHE